MGQDVAVVFLQLVDDGKCRIALETVELLPDGRVLEPSRFFAQFILADVLQKLVEEVADCLFFGRR